MVLCTIHGMAQLRNKGSSVLPKAIVELILVNTSATSGITTVECPWLPKTNIAARASVNYDLTFQVDLQPGNWDGTFAAYSADDGTGTQFSGEYKTGGVLSGLLKSTHINNAFSVSELIDVEFVAATVSKV